MTLTISFSKLHRSFYKGNNTSCVHLLCSLSQDPSDFAHGTNHNTHLFHLLTCVTSILLAVKGETFLPCCDPWRKQEELCPSHSLWCYLDKRGTDIAMSTNLLISLTIFSGEKQSRWLSETTWIKLNTLCLVKPWNVKQDKTMSMLLNIDLEMEHKVIWVKTTWGIKEVHYSKLL